MAQVFLSYARGDAAKARPIAAAIEKAGHSIWWDRQIGGGTQYSKVIEEALAAAQVVVVLWSAEAVDSHWVRDEAAAGRDSGRLVPVTLDGTAPPLGFRQFQAIDLSRGSGRLKQSDLAGLANAIASVASGAKPAAASGGPGPARPSGFINGLLAKPWLLVALLIGLGLLALGLSISRPWEQRSHGVYTVAVTASDQATRPLARDLLVNLGRLQSAKSGSVRLLGDDGQSQPDFLFQSASNGDQKGSSASVMLMDGKDRSVLWSKDFTTSSGSLADLKLQVAYTAARVLGCTVEGLQSKSQKLDQQSLKLFLNACADYAELAGIDPTPVRTALLQIVDKRPEFLPAWKLLLSIEAEAVDTMLNNGVEDFPERPEVEKHIRQARKLDPNMPEALLAQLPFIPRYEFGRRLDLIEQALRVQPDNVYALNEHARALQAVGRLEDAIGELQYAVSLDPLSPSALNSYVSGLAYAGQTELALEQLKRAEKLWPDTAAVRDMEYRYNLRFGDPEVARRLAGPDQNGRGMVVYLNARVDPNPRNVEALSSFIETRSKDMGPSPMSFMAQALGEFHHEDQLFALLGRIGNRHYLSATADIWFRPSLTRFRQDRRFMQVMKTAGLVDYWQKSGQWPDFCRQADLPYDCKAEAAKLR